MRKIIALLLISSNLIAAGGAPPLQSASDAGNSNLMSTAFSGNTTAGKTIVILVGQASATWTMLVGPTNSCGDTFTEASNSPVTGTGFRIRIYTAPTSGGCGTMTMTSSDVAPYGTWIGEYSDMDNSDLVECVASGTGSSTSLLTGSCVTANPNTTLVSFGFMPADSRTFTAGSGYTIEHQSGGTGHSEFAQDRNVTATGTYTGSATVDTTGDWGIHVMALNNIDQTVPTTTGSITMQSGTGTIINPSGTGTIISQ